MAVERGLDRRITSTVAKFIKGPKLPRLARLAQGSRATKDEQLSVCTIDEEAKLQEHKGRALSALSSISCRRVKVYRVPPAPLLSVAVGIADNENMSNERIYEDTDNKEYGDVCTDPLVDGNLDYQENGFDEWKQCDEDSLEQHLHAMGTTMSEFNERIDEMNDNNIETEELEGDRLEEYFDELVAYYNKGVELLAESDLWSVACKLFSW